MPRFICQGTWTDGGGVVVNEGTVTVYLAGGTTEATIYEAETGSAASDNTVESDVYGHFVFWVDPSDYDNTQKFKYVLSKTSFASKTYDNIVIFPNRTWIDVEEDYGAKGDGSTDDTTAIQAALDAGDLIVFRPGATYKHNRVEVNSGQIINFNGAHIVTSLNSILYSVLGTSGSEKSNIIFKNLASATASTIGTGGQMFIHTDWANHVDVLNCKNITDFAGCAVKFGDGSSYVKAKNCSAINIGAISFYAEGLADGTGTVHHVWFLENEADEYNYGIEGKWVTDMWIGHNNIHDQATGKAKPAISVIRAYDTGDEPVAERIHIFRNNIKDGQSADGAYGILLDSVIDSEVTFNIIDTAGDTGIQVNGSHIITHGNLVKNGQTDVAYNFSYNATLKTGTGGANEQYDKTYMTITSNKGISNQGASSVTFLFTDIQGSLIAHLTALDQTGTTYGFEFNNCDDSTIKDLIADAGYAAAMTYGYRLGDDNDNLTWNNNVSLNHTLFPMSFEGTAITYYTRRDGFIEEYVARGRTTASETIVLWSKTLVNNVVYDIEASITGSRTDAVKQASYKVAATVYRDGGNATILDSVTVIHSAESNGGMNGTITVSSNDVRISVTDDASETILWTAVIKTIKAR